MFKIYLVKGGHSASPDDSVFTSPGRGAPEMSPLTKKGLRRWVYDVMPERESKQVTWDQGVGQCFYINYNQSLK